MAPVVHDPMNLSPDEFPMKPSLMVISSTDTTRELLSLYPPYILGTCTCQLSITAVAPVFNALNLWCGYENRPPFQLTFHAELGVIARGPKRNSEAHDMISKLD